MKQIAHAQPQPWRTVAVLRLTPEMLAARGRLKLAFQEQVGELGAFEYAIVEAEPGRPVMLRSDEAYPEQTLVLASAALQEQHEPDGHAKAGAPWLEELLEWLGVSTAEVELSPTVLTPR